MVPHLITALTGPINELEQRMLESLPAIERWFRLEWMEHTPPFYTSVDLRNAGFKLAPVDTNLFPGGFNNLTTEMLPLAVQAAMAAIEKICPEAKNLLLIPEKHTRNSFYLMNVARLMEIFHQAGLNVRLGTLDETITAPTEVPLPDGSALTVEPLVRTRGPPRPEGLRSLHDPAEQRPVGRHPQDPRGPARAVPAAAAARRLGDAHARRTTSPAYEEVAKKFAKLLGMDPWLINPMFARCGEVNFTDGSGAECLMSNAETLLGKIRRKYKEYGIQEKPFIIVKADAGTYGMGIMTVRDPKELADLNRALAQQDERHQGRPGGERGHPPGRRADLRARQRRGRRAGRLHDRPLCRRRLLSRQCRARHRREPELARRELRAARLRRLEPAAASRAASRARARRTASTCTV